MAVLAVFGRKREELFPCSLVHRGSTSDPASLGPQLRAQRPLFLPERRVAEEVC